jgi:hypothetical protein
MGIRKDLLVTEEIRRIFRPQGDPLSSRASDCLATPLALARLEFCILHCHLCPFYEGLQDFSRVRIQSGVAKNLFLPASVA